MIKYFLILVTMIFISSCSLFGGSEGYFPDKKYDFLDEELSEDVVTTDDLELNTEEDHYPIDIASKDTVFQEVRKPRQIFSAGGASEVQLRRLGELLWIYVETLPSTTWPITRSYWETSEFQLLDANPETGVMLVDFNDEINFKIIIEHGIKESSSEIFLSGVQKDEETLVELDQEEIQPYLVDIVNYIADSVGTFSGTSLAAQSLNDKKKIVTNLGQQINVLSEIRVYGLKEEVPLNEIFERMYQLENGQSARIKPKASKEELESYFFEVFQSLLKVQFL